MEKEGRRERGREERGRREGAQGGREGEREKMEGGRGEREREGGWRRRGEGEREGRREGGREGGEERGREENNWEAIRQLVSIVPTEYKNGRVHCEGLDTKENAVPNKDPLPLPYSQHGSHADHVNGLFLLHS